MPISFELEAEKNQAIERLNMLDNERNLSLSEWEQKYNDLEAEFQNAQSQINAVENGKNLVLARFEEVEIEKNSTIVDLEHKIKVLEEQFDESAKLWVYFGRG